MKKYYDQESGLTLYKASATDERRAQSRCNAIARRAAYDGKVEAWLDKETGLIRYVELVGMSYIACESPHVEMLAYATCYSWR